jgi:hypothetical protein
MSTCPLRENHLIPRVFSEYSGSRIRCQPEVHLFDIPEVKKHHP